jgi:uncharacterized delta-60 repeat protein
MAWRWVVVASILLGSTTAAAAGVVAPAPAVAQIGSQLDPGFNNGHEVSRYFDGKNAYFVDLDRMSNGHIVALGSVDLGGITRAFVASFTAAGALDTNFGTRGIVLLSEPGPTVAEKDRSAVPVGLEVGPNDDIYVAGWRYNNDFSVTSWVTRIDSFGQYDAGYGDHDLAPGFNTNGNTITNFEAEGLSVDSTGRAVVVGTGHSQRGPVAMAFRLEGTHGFTDTTFGSTNDGREIFHSMIDVQAIRHLDGGGYFVGGTSRGLNLEIGRLTDAGIPDLSFGGSLSGFRATQIGAGESFARFIAVQSNGQPVLVGVASSNGNTHAALVRYTTAGTIDTSFNSDGKALIGSPLGNSGAVVARVQSDGKLVFGGFAGSRTWLCRLTTAGTIDSTYSGNGCFSTAASGPIAEGLVLDGTNRALTGGAALAGAVVMRVSNDGTLDHTFSSNGITVAGVRSDTTDSWSVTRRSDGVIGIAGMVEWTDLLGDTVRSIVVAAFNTDGSLRTAFGGSGYILQSFFKSTDDSPVLTTDGSGGFVVADADGQRLRAQHFGNTGTLLDVGHAFATGFDFPNKIIRLGDGSVVVGGNGTTSGGRRAYALAKFNSSMKVDTTFGQHMTLVGAGDAFLADIGRQSNGDIIEVGDDGSAVQLVAFTGNGDVDTHWGNNGRATVHWLGTDSASGLAVRADDRLVIAGTTQDGAQVGLAQLTSHGATDTGFGTNGTTTFHAGGGASISAVDLDSHGRIVLAGGAVPATGSHTQGFLVDRRLANGGADTTFAGGQDFVISPFGFSFALAHALTVEPSDAIDVTGFENDGDDNTQAVLARYLGSTTKVSIQDTSVAEGNSGTTKMNFDVTLDGPSATPVSVHWVTADNSATAPSDYTAASGVVTFPPGETMETVTVDVHGDTTLEPGEVVNVILSNPTNAIIDDGIANGIIENDDPLPALSISNLSKLEGSSGGTTNFAVSVTMTNPSYTDVTVHYATSDGTATAPSDYTSKSGTLTIPAGSTAAPIMVLVVADTTIEPDETFTVTLSNPTNATIAHGTATVTIRNDD